VNQNLKPRKTLGLKLLLGATAIVLILMSAVFLLAFNFLSEETNTFTFELQANQSQLLGQRFSNIVETATNTLKVLPTLDNQTRRALESQENIKNLEVYRITGEKYTSKRVFSWGQNTLNIAPSKEIIDELLKSGVTYQANRAEKDQTSVYLYSLIDTDDDSAKRSIVRAELNLSSLLKKSGGSASQIVNKLGQILLDTRNSQLAGNMINLENPLFKAAAQSPISLGTLEYKMPETQETHLGTYTIPGYNVMILSSLRHKDAMKGTYMLLEKMLLMGLALLGASLLVVLIFSIRLTRPLAELTEATNVISGGNFDLVLNEGSSDEIGVLSRSMNRMSQKIKELLKESVEKVRIEQEVAIASTLQQNLIPPPRIVTPRYALRSHYQAAAECGGDWWGFVETDRDLTILISDATGHGLPPAMLTAAAHGCFSAVQKILLEFPELAVSPSRLLRIANQVVVDSAKNEINMTMFVATYNFKAQTLTYANAGHNTPMILRENSTKVDPLRSRGTRLGEKEFFEPSEDATIPFSDSDILFMYTDGLLENVDRSGQEYGKERLREHLIKTFARGMEGISEDLDQDLDGFYQGIIPNDDVTYVMFGKHLTREPHQNT